MGKKMVGLLFLVIRGFDQIASFEMNKSYYELFY